MSRKLFLTGFFIFTLGAFLLAQIEEQVRVDLVEVWVKITDKNNTPVTDLRPEEFNIYIDGKKMDLRCFDASFEVQPDQEGWAEAPSLNRKFILFFDMLNTPAQDVAFLKSKVNDFLQSSFTENDQGMVFVLLPNLRLGVVQKMTSNKEALLDVVSKLIGNPTLEARKKNNERQLIQVLYTGGRSPSVTTSPAGTTFSRSTESFRQARTLAQSFASEEENLSKLTVSSFVGVSNYLLGNQYEGRLVMIYFSSGFSIRPGQNYYEIVNKATELESLSLGDMVFRESPDYSFEKEVRKTLGILNRLNVTIYTVDASGLNEIDRRASMQTLDVLRGSDSILAGQERQDSLAMIALETGGLAFLNSQNYQKGLGEVATDIGQQYFLCSNAPNSKKRGTYHQIEVKVARSDLNIRHRKGYVD